MAKPPVRGVRTPKRGLEGLGISISNKGVTVRVHDVAQDGSLYVKSTRRYADLNRAIRGESHAIEDMAKRAPKHEADAKRAEEIHAKFANWAALSPAERGRAMAELNRLPVRIEGERPVTTGDPFYKQAAEESAEEASAENNPPRIAAKLVQVKRYLRARADASPRQISLMQRRVRALAEEKNARDDAALLMLRRTMGIHHALSKPDLPESERAALAREMGSLKLQMLNRGEWAFRGKARRHVESAISRFKKGDQKASRSSLREADRSIAEFAAKHMPLPGGILRQIAKSGDSKFRENVASGQLKLCKENIEFWEKPNSPYQKTPAEMQEILSSIASVAPETEIGKAATEASKALQSGGASAAKRILSAAVGQK